MTDLLPSSDGPRPEVSPGNTGALVRSGADLVELVERLYLRLFGISLGLVVGASGLSVIFAVLQPTNWHRGATAGAAAASAAAAFIVLRGGAGPYFWLRRQAWGPILPGALGGLTLLLGGPGGALWFVALAGIGVTSVLASPRQTMAVAVCGTGCYILGTVLPGGSLVSAHDPSRLAAAGGLALDGLLCLAVVDSLARFVLRLYRFELEASGWHPRPVFVGDVGGSARRPEQRVVRLLPRGSSRLTARQLEVVVLLRDGLRQDEIAVCLSISARQVERLVAEARRRVDAKTTAELVASLVRGGLVPALGPPD